MSSPVQSPPAQSPPVQKATRRPHAKTRTGCRVCKTRKVKCDESRPSCRNCLRRGITCDFNKATRLDIPSPQSSTGRTPTAAPAPSPAVSSVSHQPAPPTGSFSALDLELLHHFTTSTCFTFSTDPMVRNLWRVNVPRISFSHQYVLQAILSLASLHLARIKPQRRDVLIEQAMVHHNASSSLAVPILNDVSSGDSAPIFFFSMLTTYIAFASPKNTDDLLVVSSSSSSATMPEWLFLFRGMRSVIDVTSDTIHSMLSLGIIFDSAQQINSVWESGTPPEHEGLKELESLFSLHAKDDPEKLDELFYATDYLRRTFAIFYGNNFTDDQRLRSAFMWLFKLRQSFVNLLKERDNEALCVLAFFCVLLQRLDYNWWIEGWGVHLVAKIYSVLTDRYRLWIRWPIEEIGWVP